MKKVPKTRLLRISPDLWMSILTNPSTQRFVVSENLLPADAKCVEMIPDAGLEIRAPAIWLCIESATFRDDDPDDLPDPMLTMVSE